MNKTLKTLDPKITDKNVKTLMAAADKNGDGKISKEGTDRCII